MSHRSLRSRAGALAAATTLALLAGLAPSAVSSSATATSDVFAPQLVTVETPTRAAKQRLQKLGLDLTEHAGRDYVEVVLHNALDQQKLVDHGFELDVRIADLVRRTAEVNAINEQFAALSVRPRRPRGTAVRAASPRRPALTQTGTASARTARADAPAPAPATAARVGAGRAR